MHQKLLCIDNFLFIGSMNITPTSLHDDKNIFIGIYHPFLAHQVSQAIQKQRYPAKLITTLQGQNIELCFLPEDQTSLSTLIERIAQATHSIYIAMYYFTHPKLVNALVGAFQRGVHIQLIVQAKTKQVEQLAKLGMDIRLHKQAYLMHLKWMVIDDEFLFVGSTNWTKSAFQKNDEAHMWLYPLNQLQRKELQIIWQAL